MTDKVKRRVEFSLNTDVGKDIDEAVEFCTRSFRHITINKETLSRENPSSTPISHDVFMPVADVIEAGIRYGARWQKHHMMKDAIDTRIEEYVSTDGQYIDCDVSDKGFKKGDKVKLIIIREN